MLPLDKPRDPRLGSRLGAWQLERTLGAGGMGVVYLARRADQQFEKKAAVKIVRLGIETGLLLKQFYRERQMLAGLEHPHIARLLDGGVTEDGYPFLVMEYVEGEKLDAHCHGRKLGLRERLRLFRKICSAVRYLHANLIVHCDLKPSNILVTAEGEPKLLDFGIARWLNEADAGHQTASLFTPRFAAPEQMLSKPVTTRCDVYSLGVILYELAVGESPYGTEDRTPLEWMQAVQQTEPKWPRGAVPRELEQIISKALQKDPAGRYGSVEAFDEDLRRYLEGLPVLARPQTLAYRAGKFVRRNRVAVGAAAAVMFAIGAGAGVAQRERLRAERRFEEVRQLARLILYEFHDGIMNVPGSTKLQKDLIAKTLDHLERMAKEASGDDRLLAEVGESYLRLGNLQGNPYNPNLGEGKLALQTYDRGLQLLANVAAGKGGLPLERARALLYRSRSEVSMMAVNEETGKRDLDRAIAVMRELVKREPDNIETRAELASTLGSVGDFYNGTVTGRLEFDKARQGYEDSLEQWRQVLSRKPGYIRAQRGIAIVSWRLGGIDQDADRMLAALDRYKEASRLLAELDPVERETLPTRRVRSSILRSKGETLTSLNRFPEALESLSEAMSIQQEMLAADPGNQQMKMGVAVMHRTLGTTYEAAGDIEKALVELAASSKAFDEMAALDPGNKTLRERRAYAREFEARLLVKAGRIDSARQRSRESLTIRRGLAERPEAGPEDWIRYGHSLWEVQPEDMRNLPLAIQYYERAKNSGKPVSPELDGWIAEARKLIQQQ